MRGILDRLPGMEVALAGADPAGFDAFRLGANDWGLLVVDPADQQDAAEVVRSASAASFRPSASLHRLAAAATFARLELDTCGAWVTLATVGRPRPTVVRRAGWIDVRGHVNGQDDRVGLGPGDAIVFVDQALADRADEGLSDALLDCAGASARSLAEHVLEAAGGLGAAFVVRVPEEADRDPMERLVEATGLPAEELQLPGYPLGDEQPDLWSRPPEPPREARIRLAPLPASVPRMRGLLGRLQSSWRMPDVSDGVVELLASELAANAIQHAKSDLTVIVRYLGDVIRIEMGDGSRELPRPRQAAEDDLDGRGLALVDALAADWGVLPTRTGKRVWCDVKIDTGRFEEGDG